MRRGYFVSTILMLSICLPSLAGTYSGGTGTEVDPYQIADVNDWLELTTGYEDWTSRFVLTDDIDLADQPLETVGHWRNHFTGVFDGNGHVVSNASLYLPSSDHYVGLFGYITTGSIIKNLILENLDVTGNYGVGGLVGSCNEATVTGCTVTGHISGNSEVGGLIGWNDDGVITDCNSIADVECLVDIAGGLLGRNNGTITNSYSGGFVTGDHTIGGLGGNNTTFGVIDNCTTTSQVTGNFCVGGLVGNNSGSGTIINCDASGPVESSYIAGGLVGGNSGSIHACSASATVTGTGPSQITYYFGGLVGINSSGGTIKHSCATGNVFNDGYQVGGLVGENDSGTISNCHADGSVDGYGQVGGLVGLVIGSSSINRCYALGDVTGQDYKVGGLVGWNSSGTISDCYAEGSVEGNGQVGGLVGFLSDTSVKYSFATGYVEGISHIGGLIGYYESTSQIYDCYWNTQTSDTLDGIGNEDPDPEDATGSITLLMKIQANFANWDFLGESANGDNEIWRMCVDGVDYPRLSWEFAANGDFACGDGVDMADLQALAEHWLTTADTSPAEFNYACDANGDETIDFADFGVLGEHW